MAEKDNRGTKLFQIAAYSRSQPPHFACESSLMAGRFVNCAPTDWGQLQLAIKNWRYYSYSNAASLEKEGHTKHLALFHHIELRSRSSSYCFSE
jgi:hypothetical protein